MEYDARNPLDDWPAGSRNRISALSFNTQKRDEPKVPEIYICPTVSIKLLADVSELRICGMLSFFTPIVNLLTYV